MYNIDMPSNATLCVPTNITEHSNIFCLTLVYCNC